MVRPRAKRASAIASSSARTRRSTSKRPRRTSRRSWCSAPPTRSSASPTGRRSSNAAFRGLPMALEVKSLTGEEINTVLPALARLRIVVFHDWPYLYDGSLEYEEKYLAKLAAAPGAVCIIAKDGEE